MSHFSLSRRLMIVMTVAAVALGGIALPAAGHGRADHGTEQADSHRGKGGKDKADARTSEAKARKDAAKARKEAAKARKSARFVAVGFVQQVDTASVTILLKGGTLKAQRRAGEPVEVTVAADAKVKRDGERVALSALQVGDHVMAKGARDGDTFVARKVIASAPEADDDDDAVEESEESEDTEAADDDDDSADDTAGDETVSGDDSGSGS